MKYFPKNKNSLKRIKDNFPWTLLCAH